MCLVVNYLDVAFIEVKVLRLILYVLHLSYFYGILSDIFKCKYMYHEFFTLFITINFKYKNSSDRVSLSQAFILSHIFICLLNNNNNKKL